MCDEDWLYRHARIKRCLRKDAVTARGFVRWDGVEGTPVLPAGTQIQRDDQVTFTTTATVTAADGLLRVPVVADEPGAAGNTDDGIAMQLGTPVSGLPSTGYADTITDGEDIENLEIWRARVMERYYYIPQGGADPDYVIWAKEVQGINRAWTFRHWKGIGTVGVMVATNDPEHPAPDESVINAVREHILPLTPVESGEGQQAALTINSLSFQAGHKTTEPLAINHTGVHFAVVPALTGKPLTINRINFYAARPMAEPLVLSRAQLHSGLPTTDPMTMNSAQLQTGYRTRSPVPVNSMQLQTASRTREPLLINHPGLHFAVVTSE